MKEESENDYSSEKDVESGFILLLHRTRTWNKGGYMKHFI
jgi:hypothetical protein